MIGLSLAITSGGAPPVFDPLTSGITGIFQDLWAQPGLVTLSGSKVTTWTERSGATGSSNATQGTDANRPTYDATGINGRPCITFSTANWLTPTMSKTIGDWTAFVVYQPDNTTGTGSGTGEYLLDIFTGRLILMHLSPTVSGSGGYYDGVFRLVACAAGPQIVTYRLNSSGGNSASIRRNGVDIATGLAYTQRAIGGTQSIGSDYLHSGVGGQFFGKMGRLILASGNLSTANVQTMERGIGAYYGITVA